MPATLAEQKDSRLRKTPQGSLYGAPAAIALAVVLLLQASAGAWWYVEHTAYDARVQLLESMGLARGEPTGTTVVVGMEEDSMVTVKPLIFWYPEIGRFLSMMDEAGAASVGIDLIPIHSLGKKMMESVSEIMAGSMDDNAVALMEGFGQISDNSILAPMLYADNMTVVQGVADGTVPYYYPLMAFMPSVVPASVRLLPDKDTVVRRQALSFMQGQDEKIDSFAQALYKVQVPESSKDDSVILNFSLRSGVKYYSFTDMLAGKYDLEELKGKSVLLGYITNYDDVHHVPLGTRIPGVIIHAVTIETLLTGTGAREIPAGLRFLAVALLAMAALLVSVRQRPLEAGAIVVVLSALYAVINIYAFHKGSLMPMFPTVLAPLLIFGTVYPYRYLVEERHRRKLYRTFSYYMDSDVIDTLISTDAENLFKGENKDVCVIFCDIRGFTKLSNMVRADYVVSFLNGFFSRCTEVVQKHGGIVDKFIGDAMLIFFHSEEGSAQNALKAALGIIKEVESLNSDGVFASNLEGWELNIGLGIHYGRVIMGNIGSEKKMDFTIIGEPVNIASRIEGLSKKLGHPLIATEEIYEMAKNDFKFKQLGKHRVRGIDSDIDLYTVIG